MQRMYLPERDMLIISIILKRQARTSNLFDLRVYRGKPEKSLVIKGSL